MQQAVEKVFFALIRFEINGDELCDEIKNLITPDILPALFKLSKRHDLAHLVGDALDKNGLLPDGTEAKKRFLQERNMAVYRIEQLRYEYEQTFAILEELQVDYLPLKGTVLRKLYPEDWMRTSADVDVLVHKVDLGKIIAALQEKLEYVQESIGAYDAVVISPTGFHLELHFDLITKYDNETANDLLANVWDYTDRVGNSYQRIMRDDYFYYYHLAHMARHFIDGGCGVRPYVDLWLLNKKISFDKENRNALLEKGGLLKFAQASEFLSRVWLEEEPHVQESRWLEDYLLNGGVYGNKENKVVIQQGQTGSRFKYIMSRIFMPLEEMQYRYEVLKKHKWLYPFMVVRRCFEVLFKGDSKRIKKELKTSDDISSEKQKESMKLIEYLGLKL